MKNEKCFMLMCCMLLILSSCTHKKSGEYVVCDTIPLHSYKSTKLENVPFIKQLLLADDGLYISPSCVDGLLFMDLKNDTVKKLYVPAEMDCIYKQGDDIFGNSFHDGLVKYNLQKEKMRYIHVPDSLRPMSCVNFFVVDSVFYFFSNKKYKKNVISTYNLSNKEVREWGTLSTIYDDESFRFRSSRHLLSFENSIYAIGRFIPIVERFSDNADSDGRLDLKCLQIVNDNLREKQIQKGRLPYILVHDCCIENGMLYLLIDVDKGVSGGRHILAVNLDEKMSISALYELSDCKEISHFTMKGDLIIGFDAVTKELLFYKMNP